MALIICNLLLICSLTVSVFAIHDRHDDLVIASECWRASSEWNDLLNDRKLSQTHIIKQAVRIDFCDCIVEEALKYAAKNGWETNRHPNAATTDINTIHVDGLNESIIKLVNEFYPSYTYFYDVPSDLLQIMETFVVKYELKEGAHNKLNTHEDGSDYSFVLALNHPNEYEGGGTRFANQNDSAIKINKGDLLIFPGKLAHEGVAVTKGIRYILTGFLTIKPMADDTNCRGLFEQASVTVTNCLDEVVDLFWANPRGKDRLQATIQPGKWEQFDTHKDHHFYYRSRASLCDLLIEDTEKKYYDIGDSTGNTCADNLIIEELQKEIRILNEVIAELRQEIQLKDIKILTIMNKIKARQSLGDAKHYCLIYW